jgi:hypothetical protein
VLLPVEKVSSFLSNQSIQAPSNNTESNALRRGLATALREASHQSTALAPESGEKRCQPKRLRNRNQNSQLNTQPARRWSSWAMELPLSHRSVQKRNLRSSPSIARVEA